MAQLILCDIWFSCICWPDVAMTKESMLCPCYDLTKTLLWPCSDSHNSSQVYTFSYQVSVVLSTQQLSLVPPVTIQAVSPQLLCLGIQTQHSEIKFLSWDSTKTLLTTLTCWTIQHTYGIWTWQQVSRNKFKINSHFRLYVILKRSVYRLLV